MLRRTQSATTTTVQATVQATVTVQAGEEVVEKTMSSLRERALERMRKRSLSQQGEQGGGVVVGTDRVRLEEEPRRKRAKPLQLQQSRIKAHTPPPKERGAGRKGGRKKKRLSERFPPGSQAKDTTRPPSPPRGMSNALWQRFLAIHNNKP